MTKSYPHTRSNLVQKKSLGQNFLVNEKVYQFMVQEIAPQKGEVIIEVGPGEGVLTEHLAKSEARIIAVEKDHRLIPSLKEKFKYQKNVTITEEDILKFDPKKLRFDLFADPRSNLGIFNYKLVGNIPYYLTSHLLRITLEDWPKPKSILFMVQKEVAQRMTAKPPRMNLLALSVQFFAKAKIVKKISRGNFRPTPKVDSALVKIIPKEKFAFDKLFQKNFFQLAQAAFQNKRKQILNSLTNNLTYRAALFVQGSPVSFKDFLNQKMAGAGIEPTRRPESLSVEEWERITKAFWPEQLSA